jgi:hypothetical protein
MLQLTDIGITHLFAAARTLPPNAREDFLIDLALRFDPEPSATKHRLALARAKYRRWAANARAGFANARKVKFDGKALARLIKKGWLAHNSEELYTPDQVGAAISDLIQSPNLPFKTNTNKSLTR